MRPQDYRLPARGGLATSHPATPGRPIPRLASAALAAPRFGPDDHDLDRWAADARVDAAATARSRERSIGDQEREATTLAGVLVALAERGAAAVIDLAGDTRVTGVVAGVGIDVCWVRGERGDALVALAAVVAVRPLSEDRPPAGDRRRPGGPSSGRPPPWPWWSWPAASAGA